MERRRFLQIAGLGATAVAADGCAGPRPSALIPYLVASDDITPGVPVYYATTCGACPAGCGMLAKTIDGRVIKAEGLPHHPINSGRLCARGQASVQRLYDPDRFRGPVLRDANGVLQAITWEAAESVLAGKLREAIAERGDAAVGWLGGLQTGSMARLVGDWMAALGARPPLYYEPFDYAALRRAAELVFGRRQVPAYDFDAANLILSFGAEFLESWISPVEFARGYARLRGRRAAEGAGAFVSVSARRSMTALNADRWVSVPPGAEVFVALAMTQTIAATRATPSALRDLVAPYTPEATGRVTGVAPDMIRTLARQFTEASPSLAVGGSVTAAGENPVALEAAVLLLNAAAGNIGRSLHVDRVSALDTLATYGDVIDLIGAMAGGEIELLFVHQANPAYTLPPSSGIAAALDRVRFVVSFAPAPDETTAHAHLVLPDHHFLESWGDASPRPGVDGLRQPAMSPYFGSRPAGDVLLHVARAIGARPVEAFAAADFAQYVREAWAGSDWEAALRHGGRFAEPQSVPAAVPQVSAALTLPPLPSHADDGLTLVISAPPLLYDGRDANAPWLQEVPDPVTKAVWNAPVELHPDAARALGIRDGDAIAIESAAGRLTAAAHLSHDVHPRVVAVPFGYGRSASLRYAGQRGPSALALVDATAVDGSLRWTATRVKVSRASSGRRLVVLQGDTPAASDADPAPPRERDLYPRHAHEGHRWGMAIDLNACTGCSACVVACYAENNVPVVGEALCAEGREMSWLRIERHDTTSMPMLCQQCDEAPCEAVCPVFATYHNPEGLNAQVYARCVGTRYCSNNCPYKVRRFNWARYTWPAPLELQLNPDVTVRSAGVMEKCTFCVQRIEAAKNTARREERFLGDGDITPACAQTCPSEAIVFGDLNDASSRVSTLSRDARGYRSLDTLNTRPAITYLKRVPPHE